MAFQLKKGLAGHGESAGAPRDLAGLGALARRFEESLHRMHEKAEEELLGPSLPEVDARRLAAEHLELARYLELARVGGAPQQRRALAAFADLLERHVRWEERELFPACEQSMSEDALAGVGHELERRLVLQRNEGKGSAKRA